MGRNGYVRWLLTVVGAAVLGVTLLNEFGPVNSSRRDRQNLVAFDRPISEQEKIFLVAPELSKATLSYLRSGPSRRETPVTREMIATLGDSELDDQIWSRLLDKYSVGERLLQAAAAEVRAYMATREFEWEVGNGGLFQYFHNHPSEEALAQVAEGYSVLKLEEPRVALEDLIWPIAKREAAWSARLEDPKQFSAGYAKSELPQYDHLVTNHDAERIKFVRAHPDLFIG